MAEKDIAVDISVPKPQSMSESHLVRKMHKPACFYCCCQKRTYKFVSPDGAEHNAAWEETPCLERCCGWICCRGYFSTIRFGSASGPDFESKKTINCCRFHICSRLCSPCGAIAGGCCAVLGNPCVGDDSCDRVFPCCRTLCKSHKVVDAKGGAGYGDIREATCWSSCCQLCFPCKAYPIYTSYDASGAEKYVLRDNRMMVIHKLPVTAPDSQSPIAWITVTAQKAACCNGCACCYCGHRKSASLEVDHAHGLSFQERAHLMSLAMKYDEGLLVEAVGCCYNDP